MWKNMQNDEKKKSFFAHKWKNIKFYKRKERKKIFHDKFRKLRPVKPYEFQLFMCTKRK